jgi:hypothetical protein
MLQDNCNTPLKACSTCGTVYPLTPEFFQPDSTRKSGFQSNCRPCRRKSRAKWYQENKEHCLEYRREYYAEHHTEILEKASAYGKANRERLRQYDRQKYQENPHKVLDKNKRWRENNSEKQRRMSRDYYLRNQDRIKDNVKRWHKSNPDKRRVHRDVRRARMRNSEGRYTSADVQLQYKAQNGNCWWCGSPVGSDYQVDHRIPLAKGGSNTAGNIVIAHPLCNARKQDKMPWEFNGRLL